MNFKIPQNLEIEDKIVGPLTMRGLIIAGVGGGIAYLAYMKLDDQTWPIIAVPVIALTVAIIFVRINNMSFLQWLAALILLFLKPQKRVWKKLSDSPEVFIDPAQLKKHKQEQQKKDEIGTIRDEKQKKLQELAKHLQQNQLTNKNG